MQITSGKIQSAQKVVVYGPEGIGKSTFASRFPNPVFCDTEGSTKKLDVRRTRRPQSWAELLEQVRYFIRKPGELSTFVLDTADWAERLCSDMVCVRAQKTGIEDFGYGKGFTYLAEEFGRLLNLLEELVERGVHVVLTAHAKPRKFELPEEAGAYDRWEMKLTKFVAPIVKEWADIVLFASYKTIVVNTDGQGAEKGKNKAQGGKRVLRTTHHPCWDAKNRDDLPDELPFDYEKIAYLFPVMNLAAQADACQAATEAPPAAAPAPVKPAPPGPTSPPAPTPPPVEPDGAWALKEEVPPALAALMIENRVTAGELRAVVFERGYYPLATPIMNYEPDFIKGVLIGAWPQVFAMVEKYREALPF